MSAPSVFHGYVSLHSSPVLVVVPHLLEQSRLVCPILQTSHLRSLRIAAVNWPHHRGTATSFPLAAFGLGAFFFTTISVIAFPDNTSQLLILLSAGTFGLDLASIYFVRLLPHAAEYSAVPSSDRRESNPLKRNISEDSRHRASHTSAESGTPPDISQDSADLKDADETSSLISKDSASVPGDIPSPGDQLKSDKGPDIPQPDVRGLVLLRKIEFYQLFFILGLFTGFGLMTIKQVCPSELKLLMLNFLK